jgi:hypothetical protein
MLTAKPVKPMKTFSHPLRIADALRSPRINLSDKTHCKTSEKNSPAGRPGFVQNEDRIRTGS